VRGLASTLSALMLLACCYSSAAQNQAQLVNVGRLCNASVYANGVNGGGDDDNPFYGARNAFDDGQNMVKGIHYSSWMSGNKSDWIRIHFNQYTGPLSIAAITVRAEDPQYVADTMQITLGFEGGRQQQFPAVTMTRPITTYNLPDPAKNVSIVRIDFQAKVLFQIDEIQVLGQPSQYCHTTEGTPLFDGEYRNHLVIAKRRPATAEGVLHDHQIASVMKEMGSLQAQVDSAQSAQLTAEAWLNLNRKADLLVQRMSEIQPLSKDSAPTTPTAGLVRIAKKAKALGIPVSFCEIGEGWVADPAGYEKYLQLWPAGANADEAFWRSRVEANGCGDFEGSIEEYEEGIKMYRGFIERFPSSSYMPEAKSQVAAYEKGLEEAKKRERVFPPAGQTSPQGAPSKQ
jgi:hypothetical protein